MKNLFRPVDIQQVARDADGHRSSAHTIATLFNRIVMAPMTRRRAPGGVPTDDMAAYYARRAAGGVGTIITEGCHINNNDAVDADATPQCSTPEQVAGWRSVVAAVKAASGSKTAVCMQLWHTGLFSRSPVGPSASVNVSSSTRKVQFPPQELSAADLARIADEFAATASRAVGDCGVDAIEIHGAHGYLLDSFASPTINCRDDAFGGDAQRRSAFAALVVERVRAAVGPAVPIWYRLSQWILTDYQHVKFATPDDFETYLVALASAGVNVVDVSTRRVLDEAFADRQRELEGSAGGVVPSLSLAGWARRILDRCGYADVLVVGVGSVSLGRAFGEGDAADDTYDVVDPAPALDAVERGEFDLLGVGRALIADPLWVRKVQDGRWRTLTPYSTKLLKELD